MNVLTSMNMNNRIKTIIVSTIIGINVCLSWADFTQEELYKNECIIDVIKAKAFASPNDFKEDTKNKLYKEFEEQCKKQHCEGILEKCKGEGVKFPYLGELKSLKSIFDHIEKVVNGKAKMFEDDRMLYYIGNIVKGDKECKSGFLEFISDRKILKKYAFYIIRTYLYLTRSKSIEAVWKSLSDFIGRDKFNEIINTEGFLFHILLSFAIDTNDSKIVEILLKCLKSEEKLRISVYWVCEDDTSNNEIIRVKGNNPDFANLLSKGLNKVVLYEAYRRFPTMLHFAVYKGNPEIVKMLLDEFYCKFPLGGAIWFLAEIAGNREVIEILKNFHLKYNMQSAVKNKNVEKLNDILNKLGEEEAAKYFLDLFRFALIPGNKDIVTTLLEYFKKEDINDRIKEFFSYKNFYYLRYEEVDLLELLWARLGKRAEFIEQYKDKLLDCVIKEWPYWKENNLNIVLEKFNIKEEFDNIKAQFDNVKKELVNDKGIDKEKLNKALEELSEKAKYMVDENGQNLLHWAVKTGDLATIEMVVDKIGSDIAKKLIRKLDMNRKSPFNLVMQMGKQEIVNLLLKLGFKRANRKFCE